MRNRVIGRLRSGASGFNPLSLFAAGEQGGWYDPSDLSSLFQDTAGTTPVTAVGQTVKRINDKSGRGNHATNSTGWPLRLENGLFYLDSIGTSTFVTSSIAWGTGTVSIWSGSKGITSGTVVSFGVLSATGSFDWGYFSSGIILYHRGSGSFGARATAPVVEFPIVASVNCTLAGTTYSTEIPNLRIDGTQGTLSDFGATDSGSGNFGTNPITIGGGDTAFNGRLYQLILRNTTTTDLSGAESYVTRKTKFGFPLTVMTFADTGAQPAREAFQLTSTFAHVDFSTTATSVDLTTWNDIFGQAPVEANIGVYIDGVFNQQITALNTGVYQTTITLPGGSKTVSFLNGLQARPDSGLDPIGTFVTRVTGNATLTPVAPTATNRVLVYGDSISVGDGSTVITQDAWALKVRAAYYPKSLAVEGWGYRSLFEDCLTAPQRAALVAKIVAYAPQRLWIAIGTNDYGLNKWSAANFGTAYAALLDDLHTALPSLTIFCQTPIVRTVETANSFANTLGDYRAQIVTAQSTRSAYATLVDGTAFMTTASLNADGIHPTTAGHALYATAVRASLVI